ncbi:epoxide hydrolase-like protein [Karstenula rhodostoma CBS 690.94]|uniref:Epoxide hydrolase-like protein n=1 Tax=Karstenula rhodostoma CBS 690.94 TaxID=1392251 RepID=A0A9P4PUN5_9PLEO|nr:epoxide hydrolase-like protein [Karstenula rhodostoma CBS 690.94]
MAYTPPSSARPFTLHVPDQDLSEWRQLLQLSRLGPKTFENTQTKDNLGITYDWLSSAKDHWLNKYDWRAQESHINSFPNYKTTIDEIDVHFVALFSQKKDATPILFMHGWPGSFIEFLPMLELLRKKFEGKELPYHIVIPSLPGYTLSSGGPLDREWTKKDSAAVMEKLMRGLGFDKYFVQGGDVGSFLCRIMADEYESVAGVHVNLYITPTEPEREKLNDIETKAYDRALEWRKRGTAYAQEHGTRPSTIGHVLSSNPLALLAWIGEKFLEWSDETPPLDAILTNVSLYYFTDSFPRSIYPYRRLSGSTPEPTPSLEKPTGYSFFPKELFPGIKYIIENETKLVSFNVHERGGHFAALERPADLWDDVEAFVTKVTENESKL